MQEIQLKENIDGLIGPPGGSPSTTSDMQVTQFNFFKAIIYWVIALWECWMILVSDGRWLVERQHGRTPCDSLCQVWLGCPPETCPQSPGLPAQAPPLSSLWLGLVSIPLRRLAQAGTCSPDSSQWNGKLLGSPAYICASSQDLQRVCVWVLNDASADLPLCKQTTSCYHKQRLR